MEFTLVSAVTPDYLPKLRLTYQTWARKKQFRGRELIIFCSGFNNPLEEIDLGGQDFKLRVIPWEMKEYHTKRELILSSFVLGSAVAVSSPYWVKLDCDVVFTSDRDIFGDNDFDYDLSSQRWGYTKPAYWIDELNKWAESLDLPGEPLLLEKNFNLKSIGHKRIISRVCLHKSDFVKECAEIAGDRLPIPSHDTYLWYMAERLPHRRWKASNLMKSGWSHRCTTGGVKAELKKDSRGQEGIPQKWFDRYKYRTEKNILNKIQIEITSKCNMQCPSCDRACGIAPSEERMSLTQFSEFINESLDLGWAWRRIDILGGEPTLHPEIMEIIGEVSRYRESHKSWVRFTTNGLGKADNILKKLPSWVNIRNSKKEIGKNRSFVAYNWAPIDLGIPNPPFCDLPWRCGIGLTKNGYFPCGPGASIARVFGLDIGLKSLKDLNLFDLTEMFGAVCRYCGHAPTKGYQRTRECMISESWARAAERYRESNRELG